MASDGPYKWRRDTVSGRSAFYVVDGDFNRVPGTSRVCHARASELEASLNAAFAAGVKAGQSTPSAPAGKAE